MLFVKVKTGKRLLNQANSVCISFKNNQLYSLLKINCKHFLQTYILSLVKGKKNLYNSVDITLS